MKKQTLIKTILFIVLIAGGLLAAAFTFNFFAGETVAPGRVEAEESLSLVKKQYEGGSATITRYLEAELDRNRARTRSAAAYYDRDKAIADIARAVGYWARISAENSGTGGGNQLKS